MYESNLSSLLRSKKGLVSSWLAPLSYNSMRHGMGSGHVVLLNIIKGVGLGQVTLAHISVKTWKNDGRINTIH